MILCNLHPRCSISLLSLILMLSAFAVPAEDTDSEVSRHFLAGRQAQSSGNLNLAVQEYLAVVRLEPDLAEARVNLGLVYYLQNRYDASAQAFEKALSTKPGLRGANLFLGIDYVKLGRARRAVPCLRVAVAQEPGNNEARIWLGTALWDSGQETEAVLELHSAAQAFPSNPDILFLLGQAYRNAANEEMERVLAIVGTPLYHQAFGDIYREEQVWDQARGHYRRALEKDPHWAGAHLGLGEIYFQQGKWDQARSEYLAEQATGAMTATASARLADIALLQGRPAEALRLLSEANQMRPDAAASALGLPALPFADNAPSGEEAKAGYRQSLRVLEKTPSAPARTLALAAVYLRLGLDEESAREWARYRATMPSSNPAGNDYERARIEFERHDFDAARSHLAAFLAAPPGRRGSALSAGEDLPLAFSFGSGGHARGGPGFVQDAPTAGSNPRRVRGKRKGPGRVSNGGVCKSRVGRGALRHWRAVVEDESNGPSHAGIPAGASSEPRLRGGQRGGRHDSGPTAPVGTRHSLPRESPAIEAGAAAGAPGAGKGFLPAPGVFEGRGGTQKRPGGRSRRECSLPPGNRVQATGPKRGSERSLRGIAPHQG